jgi:addiction module RelE/StbE family toxin
VKIRWTRPASRDLQAIQDDVAQDNPLAARQLTVAIQQRVQQLQDHPEIGRPGRVPGTRELVITDTPYIAPYRVKDQCVEILALYHSARRWPEHF